jgi:2-phospho-L-lactate guanylyltransferase
MWLIIPVKNFSGAKKRLSPFLTQSERSGLYQTMLLDVMECVQQISYFDRKSLVTRDPLAIKIAEEFGFSVIPEPKNRGHTLAVQSGIKHIIECGVKSMMTLPGDIPLVTPEEITTLIDTHETSPAPACTIAPSHDFGGSNAVVSTPADCIAPAFGPDSYRAHQEIARRQGILPNEVICPGIGLDIDTPEDLKRFATEGSSTRTQQFLDQNGIAERLDSIDQNQ